MSVLGGGVLGGCCCLRGRASPVCQLCVVLHASLNASQWRLAAGGSTHAPACCTMQTAPLARPAPCRRAISCGAEHTIAITPEDVITWGSNEYGQCGHGDKAETDWVKPRSIKMLHEQMVTQVICGRFHTLCVTATSQVYAWGRNSSGQLGLGDTQDRRGPTLVEGLWALPVLQLAAGAPGGRYSVVWAWLPMHR